MLCEYGCDRKAKYQFKNGRWCCSKSHVSCPSVKEKNRDYKTNYKMKEAWKKRKMNPEYIKKQEV